MRRIPTLNQAGVSSRQALISDHEEPMGGVTPKLLDQTILPIEVGLHRPGSDISAFVGPPVAMRRILLWQNLRRLDFQSAIVASIEHVSFPARLREPGGAHVGADTHVVGQENSRPSYRRGHIDLLHKLAAGVVSKPGDVASGIV